MVAYCVDMVVCVQFFHGSTSQVSQGIVSLAAISPTTHWVWSVVDIYFNVVYCGLALFTAGSTIRLVWIPVYLRLCSCM